MLDRPYLLLLATTTSWAGNAIAGRMAAGSVSPMVLTSLRWALAIGIVLVFAKPYLERDRETIRRHWVRLAGLGAVGFAIFNVMLYTALSYTTAMNVALIQGGMPAVILLLGFVLFGRRVRALQIVGLVLSLLGVAVIVLSGEGALGTVGRGDIIILVGILVYAGYTIALAYKPPMHWLSSIAVMGGAGFLASLPFAAWEIATGTANWPSDAGDWGIVVYAGVFPSLVAQICYIRANELIGANRAGMFTNMTPVIGTLLAVVVLGEAFRWTHALALVLTLGGIALAEWAANRGETPDDRVGGNGESVPGTRDVAATRGT